jgi:hypothetical protein
MRPNSVTLLLAAAAVWAPQRAMGQEASSAADQTVVGHLVKKWADRSELVLDLPGGESLTITVGDGTIRLNGTAIITGDHGDLAEKLSEIIRRADLLETSDVIASVRALDASESSLSADERSAAEALATTMAGLSAAQVTLPDAPSVTVSSADARPALPRRGSQIQTRMQQVSAPSFVGGMLGAVANLAAVYVALAFMGLGFLFFAPRQIEVVADTVWHSFWRSFLAGLFAQPLILPVFGALIVGLTLTVVGVLVVPFAIVGFAIALALAVVGGFVAVARTLGEIYLRRKMARGESVKTWGSYRYVVYGLLGVLSVWLPAILFARIPVAGDIMLAASLFITWMIATAGFGATLLSRGGVRATFVRRLDLALTDEQYWTAEGMPTPQPERYVRRRR